MWPGYHEGSKYRPLYGNAAPGGTQPETETMLVGQGQRLNWTEFWHNTEVLDTGFCSGPDEVKVGLFAQWGGDETSGTWG